MRLFNHTGPGEGMENTHTYNYTVVRQFAIMTVVWGVVGVTWQRSCPLTRAPSGSGAFTEALPFSSTNDTVFPPAIPS